MENPQPSTFQDVLAELFTCSKCSKCIVEETWICNFAGHRLCYDCGSINESQKCPVCDEKIPTKVIKYFWATIFASTISYYCRNRLCGCDIVQQSINGILIHEQTCRSRYENNDREELVKLSKWVSLLFFSFFLYAFSF